MASFKPVFWISIRSMIATMFPRYRKSDAKTKRRLLLYILLFAYVLISVVGGEAAMFYGLAKSLGAAGYGWLYFAVVGFAVLGLCVVGGLFLTHAQLFAAKDNELLLSLPIKPGVVLLSRIASLLVLDYIFTLIVAGPAAVIWIAVNSISGVGAVFLLLSVILLPLPAMGLSMLIAWILSAIFSRLRRSNLIKLGFYLLFFVAYLYLVTNLNGYITALVSRGAEIAEAFRRTVFPLYHLGAAITQGDGVSFFIFLVCALAPFVIMTVILSSQFLKIATTNRGVRKIEYRQKRLRASGARMAFVKKELRLFFSLPVYILNGGLGGVFSVVLSVLLAVRRDLIYEMFGQTQGALPFDVPTIAALMLCLFSALSLVSAASVSIEGNTLWIARSLPVSTYDILLAKVASHSLACGVPTLIGAIICAVALGPDLIGLLALFITPIALVVTMGFAGVAINLRFPRLDWVNPVQPVKQGASILIAMLAGAALIIAPGMLYVFLLNRIMDVGFMIFLTGVVYIGISILLAMSLKDKGARLFEELGG
ncbi:MAG TPA: hypothetical protein GXZ77_09505 [Papillibacter sp.]|jgi:ABC-2 type transport system permease protein|nr:hypothetical protein [Papillibacter sp.]